MATAITSFTAALTSNLNISWQVTTQTAGVPNPSTNPGQINPTSSYTYGSGAGTPSTARKCNQVITGLLTIAASGTNNFALNAGALPAVNGVASPTLTKIKEMLIELLSADQTDSSGTAGTACSSVIVGANGSHPWLPILGSTGTYTLTNGDKWWAQSNAGSGLSVVSTDILTIANQDSNNAAHVRITILGDG